MVCDNAEDDSLESIMLTQQIIVAHFEALEEICEVHGINTRQCWKVVV